MKSHIIPKALTKLSDRGDVYIQAGSGRHPVRRRDSWYDSRLLSRAGEDIMMGFDSWGIECLRTHQLVWSGWGAETRLNPALFTAIDEGRGIRGVEPIDTAQLRLFFLSVLWRAAASELEEFSEIQISTSDLDRIKKILLREEQDDPAFFPITLTQFSTRAAPHNHTPFRGNMDCPSIDGAVVRSVPLYRFYFDGLVSHFLLPREDDLPLGLGPTHLGWDKNRVVLPAITFEISTQLRNIQNILSESLWRD